MKQSNRTEFGEARRNFVFLQGPTSTVFRDLGRALAARGHGVVRVNLCPGDWLMWHGKDAVTYRGSLAKWPDFLRALMKKHEATDIVYFADRFPYHKAAQRVAAELGARAVSVEYGYIRPDWMILEEGGQSAYSHVPNDPDVIRAVAKDLASVDTKPLYTFDFSTEAFNETAFHVSNALLAPILMPRYAPNRYYPTLKEFLSYVPRLLKGSKAKEHAEATVERLKSTPGTRFLVPMQMQSDYQLRDNAPPGYHEVFLQEVFSSFAAHAPADAELVVKLHPMDQGLEHWEREVPKLAEAAGIGARVHVIDGGSLNDLFDMAKGVIVINSTVGLTALRAHVPVLAKGVAIYDVPGITHQGTLDSFWTAPEKPDAALLRDWVRAMAHSVHVRGLVYGEEGRAAFIKGAIERMEAPDLLRNGFFVPVPPRLAKAKAMGVTVDWPGQGATQ